MHIAIEGMDGTRKTSQAKLLAQRINGEFIPKSFHEMNDTSGIYDNFVTIDKFTYGRISGSYGIHQNYFFNKIENNDIVTDRFYISNYWSRADDLSIEYFKKISTLWGEPDLIIVLYARSEILYDRIYKQNKADKDLTKLKMAKKAYKLMFDFINEMKFKVLVIDTSEISFEETSEIIFNAYENGVENCVQISPEICSIMQPYKNIIENDTAVFECYGTELVKCINKTDNIKIPEDISYIRDSAFSYCKGKIRINISKNVNTISTFAFSRAEVEYISVDLENNYFAAAEGLLYDKSFKILIKVPCRIKNIYLKEIKIIENSAFLGCNEINKIVVKKGVESIGYAAFSFCKNLKELIFEGDEVTFIAPGCFYECDKIDYISIDTTEYHAYNKCIMDKNENILYYYGSKNLIEYKISCNTYIYPFAFYKRLNISELTVNLKKIGSFAFKKCNIDTLYLGEKAEDIGEESFLKTNITRIYILNTRTVMSIWNNTFDKNVCIILTKNIFSTYCESKNWKNNNICFIIGKKNESQLCGAACLEYIKHSEKYSKEFSINPNLKWVTELAIAAEDVMDKKTQLYCFKSQLLNDYNKNINSEKYEMILLGKYINNYRNIIEKDVSINDLIEMTKQYQWIIMCLKSDILFLDDSLKNSNHFIILDRISENGTVVISPGKDMFYKMFVPIERLIEAMSNNGQWIIGMVPTV